LDEAMSIISIRLKSVLEVLLANKMTLGVSSSIPANGGEVDC
jgi:hypothetical protein